ncbi:MAG: helix-turn-helix domain-containing protein [Prevotella sp.]|nr:helix-turn-helix domain-containing protein [Prevotella sp.]
MRFVIIDTITSLSKGKSGSSLAIIMQNLKFLKQSNDLTFLLVAHTQKRNDSTPITVADLMGGTFLSSMADSIFALNISHKDKDIRYVKQFKSRFSEIEYGDDNVLEYKIVKDNDGLLLLDFRGNTTEDEQLEIDLYAQDDLEKNVRSLHCKGWSIRKIANKFKISPSKVYRCLH